MSRCQARYLITLGSALRAEGEKLVARRLLEERVKRTLFAGLRSSTVGRMMFAMNAPGRDAARTVIAADGTRYRRPGRLAEVVVNDLARQIVGGQHAENDVLPNEPALCEQFGMSRTVVREALKMLEERGLVRVEQGRGTTVQPRNSWNLLDPVILGIALQYDDDMSLLDDLVSVRRVLEQEMTRAATPRLTDDELASLAANIEQMEASCDDYERFRAFDLGFHSIIMEASENRVGLTIVRAIHRYGGVRPQISTAAATRASLERTASEHRAIYEALRVRDSDLAGELTALHIESAWAERRASKTGP